MKLFEVDYYDAYNDKIKLVRIKAPDEQAALTIFYHDYDDGFDTVFESITEITEELTD